MKKLITLLLVLVSFLPQSAFAIGQLIPFLSWTSATGTNATTTNLFSTLASTTNLYLSTGIGCLEVNAAGKVITSTGLACGSGGGGGGAGNSKWATSTNPATGIYPNTADYVGIGTTTPRWVLQLASSTKAQLTLSDGVITDNHWSFRNAGGLFYLATSSAATFATSSTAALSIDDSSNTTLANSLTTLGNLTVNGGNISSKVGTSGLNLSTVAQITGQDVVGDSLVYTTGKLSSGIAHKFLGRSSGGADIDMLYMMNQSQYSGFGTQSPHWMLELSTSTRAQLSLNDGSGTSNLWSLRNAGGVFYLATSSATTFASSSVSALSISANGQLTAPYYAGTGCAQWDTAGALTNTGSACGGAGSTPAGSGTNWQYRNGSSFGGVTGTSYITTGEFLGVGTDTPQWLFQLATSTAPQLALSDGVATDNHWTFRSVGNSLYIATSSPLTFATTTSPSITITSNNQVGINTTAPVAPLTVVGNVSLTGTISTPGGNISLQPAGTVRATIGSGITFNPAAANTFSVAPATTNSGSTVSFLFTGASDTTLTSGTERHDIHYNLGRTVQWTGSASAGAANITLQRFFRISSPTIGFSSTAAQTVTDAATFALTGAPAAGTNALLTNSHAIYIGASAVTSSTTNSYGLTANAQTGGKSNFAAEFLGGAVGIGTSTPYGTLTVSSTTGSQISVTDGSLTSNQWNVRNAGGIFYLATSSPSTFATSTASALWLDANGGLNLGNYGNCNGTTNALGITSNLVQCDSLTSDARLKKDITNLNYGIEAINALKPVSFYWKDNNIPGLRTGDKTIQYGFIAQDVKKVLPGLVGSTNPTKYTPDETLTFNEEGIIPVLVNAVKDIWHKVMDHEDRINKLEKENGELKARLDLLEQKLK